MQVIFPLTIWWWYKYVDSRMIWTDLSVNDSFILWIFSVGLDDSVLQIPTSLMSKLRLCYNQSNFYEYYYITASSTSQWMLFYCFKMMC